MDTLKDATILAIDDDVQTLFLLNKLLVNKCKELLLQNNAAAGVKLAQKKQPDLILLDVFLNVKENGIEICQQLKADPKTQHIPVIFLSALTTPTDKVRGFSVGGVDYITKPFDLNEAIARIKSCLTTHQKFQQTSTTEPEVAAETLQQCFLNPRELQIVQLYISGYKRSDIAAKVHVSENTVKWYLKQIFQKLGVSNRAALIEKVKKLGF